MRKLRSHLQRFSLSILLPVVVAAAVAAMYLAWQERKTFQQGAEHRLLAVASAVDAELGGLMRLAQTLATLSSISKGELASFRAEAERVMHGNPMISDIYVSSPEGRPLLSLRAQAGAALPPDTPGRDAHEWVVDTGRPAVANVGVGDRADGLGFSVKAPVLRGRKLVYVLSVAVEPSAVETILQKQRLPGTWLIAVVDGAGHLVARVPGSVTRMESGSPSMLAALARPPQVWTEGTTATGTAVYHAHAPSSLSHWRVGVAVPKDEVEHNFYLALWWSMIAVGAVTGLALLSAWWLGRRIDRELTSLANHVKEFDGAAVGPSACRTTIEEVVEVRHAFDAKALQLAEKQQRLEDADRAKDVLIAMLGHELRNPLAALSAAGLVVSGTAPAAALQRAGQIIQRQCRHMARLVDDLLDVNAAVHGKLHLQKRPVNLVRVVEDAMGTFAATQRLAGRTIEKSLRDAWVNGDDARLGQVVVNLLDNAAKYTPEGGRISVEVFAAEAQAVVQVSDSGSGMTPEQLKSVFEMFYQAPQTVDRPRGGLGLGLTLVKSLVELHGGGVSAHSEGLGRGASFRITLPAVEPPAALPAPVAAGKDSSRGSRTVLVVEDSVDVLESMTALLELMGYRVLTAVNAAQALELCQRLTPDHMLVDIGLPDMSGLELARKVRAIPSAASIHMVAVSGFGAPEDQIDARQAGFDGYLIKPVDPGVLESVLAMEDAASPGTAR